MKYEIKEIIENIRKIIKSNRENEFDRIIYDSDSIENLLDYITNLQDTLKDREEYCYGLETHLTDLQEKYEEADNDRHKLFEQKEKAIEKLNSMKNIKGGANSTILQAVEIVEETLNILKGEGKK